MDAPIRVLDARVLSGTGGGPDKTILRSPRHLDARRVAMSAVYLHPEGDAGMAAIRAAARRGGCPLHEIEDRGPLDLSLVGKLADLCSKLRINVWHGHDYKTDVLGLLVRRRWPMKLVTTVHGFTRETWRTKLYYHADNLAMRGYDHVIAVSPPLLAHCRRIGVDAARLSYVPNAIEADEWVRSRPVEEAKRELGLDAARPTMIVVSRLSPEKGIDRAIRLLARLKPMVPGLTLLLVGDGREREALARLAAELGVTDMVRWYGWRADARQFYEAADTLLLPSHTEGLPNVALEAMAMGVPVAATDVGAVRDVLDDGRCGVVLDPRDADRWVQPLAGLLTSDHLRRRNAELAMERVRTRFSFAARMDAISQIYDRLIEARQVRAAA